MSQVIDIDATKQRFKDTGRKIQSYATAKGFNPCAWGQKFYGKQKFTDIELNAMRADGLLVEKEEVLCN